MNKFTAPTLRKDFIIVVRRADSELAAIAISYLFQPGSYLPIFAFNDVDVHADASVPEPDIFVIQRRRAEHFSIFLNNAIIQNSGCDTLILLGLPENQLSYLDYLAHYNVMQIGSVNELDAYLGGFAIDKRSPLACSAEQCFEGLSLALQQNRSLQIGWQNEKLSDQLEDLKGIVVIERKSTVETIIALNYAASIGAKVVIVEEMIENEDEQVLGLLEDWNNGDQTALTTLKDKINSKIGWINFDAYEYVTFFTEGLPYSLCVHSIPGSYVNLEYRPDFFIYNAFKYELNKRSGSAVVFSPIFFKDEETEKLISQLDFRNYYLRKLTGEAATNYNLKNTVEGYPFDLLHICSHGGDVRGTRCEVNFHGTDGMCHVIEFDHVLSVAITPYQDLHAVESLYYFKKMDGLIWRSEELLNRGYTHELYAEMVDAIKLAFDQKTVISKYPVARVPNANAIRCSDFNYLANFNQMASDGQSPLIFNNTCWSWMNVSKSFLASGARGYIGTLTSVPNDKAVHFAETFYEGLFGSNIIDTFHTATIELLQYGTLPLYVYWGLHFSTFDNTETISSNRNFVLDNLRKSLAIWRHKRDAGEGAKDILIGRVTDTLWILKDIAEGAIEGHRPIKTLPRSR